MITYKPEKKYFVYVLCDEVPERPFYVGKGSGERLRQHQYEFNGGCDCPKCIEMGRIVGAGRQVVFYIELETDNEAEAFQTECRLIQEIGPAILTNRTMGGEGCTPSVAERRRRDMDAMLLRASIASLDRKRHGKDTPPPRARESKARRKIS